MKFTTATIAAMVAQMAYAHTTITSVMLNGVDQGLPAPVHGIGTNLTANGYIRVPKNNDPVKDVTSPTLTCNVNNTAAPVSIPVAAGDKLTLQWHHDFITDSDDIIDGSHKGPVITYMAPAAGNGAGDVWVKIQEQGYDTTTKTWAVDTLKTNKGKVDVMVPGTLASGDYLVRQEIIALHEADTAFSDNPKKGAQLYPGCVQITVANGGSTVSFTMNQFRERSDTHTNGILGSSSRCSYSRCL